ncbi:MAG: acyltransferase [Beduini sp.]|uniref:acyltransferase n=1 Tax=Beduini sp. TaxID=1922300 RepID=UPI0011CB4A92
MIKQLINRLLYSHTYSSEAYIRYLRKNGAVIGKNTRFVSPKQCRVDSGRMDHISIGDNCCIVSSNLIAHDYSWYVLIDKYERIIPDAGDTIQIGNNVFLGLNTTVLKGVTIGDNVIVGANSLVNKDLESNSIYAGNPIKKICTLEEYYQKREKQRLQEAFKKIGFYKYKYNRNPTIKEMNFFSFLWLKRTKENYEQYIKPLKYNGISNHPKIKNIFFNSKPEYESFESLLIDFNLQKEEEI